MKNKRKRIELICVFGLMFFWDLIEKIFPNGVFFILIMILFVHIMLGAKIKIERNVILIILLVFFHGIINVVLNKNEVFLLISQLGSIVLSYITYNSIISECSIQEVFYAYFKTAFIMSAFGIVQLLICALNISALSRFPLLFTFTKYETRYVGNLPRISSLCSEPSFLGYFLAPAVFLIICRLFAPELLDLKAKRMIGKWYQSLVIMGAYIFSFSSVAYIGIAIMFVLIWLKKTRLTKKVLMPVVGVALFILAYMFVEPFKLRVDDTLGVLFGKEQISLVNLSTYTLLNNFHVAKEAFIYNMGLGSGLGSYKVMFDKFSLGGWQGTNLFLNRMDGNSMFIRLITELGLFGMIGLVYYLVHFRIKGRNSLCAYSLSILTLLLLFLLRMGNYTHAGSVLFVCLYMKIYYLKKKNDTEYQQLEERI